MFKQRSGGAKMHRLVLERQYHQQQQRMANKHIAVSTWLEALGLSEYLTHFHKYPGVEDLLYVHEGEIRDLGIKNGAHRAKIVSSLRVLRDKYEKGKVSGHGGIPFHRNIESLPSPPSPVNHPDYQSLNVSSEKLQEDLQKELQADPSELKSRPWYHGNISRQRAEYLVVNDGEFLVRDCISRPGDFVLTCSWRGVPLHFMINALVGDSVLGALPKITYQFEEESFNSIQDLIQFYQANQKPVTNSSAAVLKHPIARSMPLSYYDSKYGALFSLAAFGTYSSGQSPRVSPFATPTGSPSGSPGMDRRVPKRTGSQPLLSLGDCEVDRSRSPSLDRCDSLPVINSTPKSGIHHSVQKEIPSYHQRSGSEPVLTPNVNVTGNINLFPPSRLAPAGSDGNLSKPPPPKPSRIPSIKYKVRPNVAIRNKELYEEDDGRDYSDYCQVKEEPSWIKLDNSPLSNKTSRIHTNPHKNVSICPTSHRTDIYDNNLNNLNQTGTYSSPTVGNSQSKKSKGRLFSDTRFSVIDSGDGSLKENVIDDNDNDSFIYDMTHPKSTRTITIPSIKSKMNFDLLNFSSSLLPQNNKPLEASTMISMKSILLEGNVKSLARHMTKVDLDMLHVLKEYDFGVSVQSGLELITLPQGKQLCQNLIERCHCMTVFVMVSMLTCNTMTERAQMLSQWIQIALELKVTMGNLFGFVNVMEGLTAPQIQRLQDTWLILRQNHTGSAYVFDTKLKTAFRMLNDGSSALPLQNVCIPHINPIVYLMEKDLDSIMTTQTWEEMDSLFGLDTLLAHLDVARIVASQFGLYRITGNSIVSDMKEDSEMLDMFRTELHIRLLWGLKGSGVNRQDRHNKFEQLLTVLSERAEPQGDDGTAV